MSYSSTRSSHRASPPEYSSLTNIPKDAPAVFLRKNATRPSPLQSSVAALDEKGCHSPYRPLRFSLPLSDSEENSLTTSPSAAAPPPYSMATSFSSVAHSHLTGQCQFVPHPVNADPDAEPTTPVLDPNHVPLFIGQVRFETSPGELKAVLLKIAEVEAHRIEPRGQGCFIVVLKCQEDADRVRMLHKRVLFDHTGCWYARNETEVDALAQYVVQYLPYLSRRLHLPRDCMVVEEQKNNLRGGNNHGAFLNSPAFVFAQPNGAANTFPMMAPLPPPMLPRY